MFSTIISSVLRSTHTSFLFQWEMKCFEKPRWALYFLWTRQHCFVLQSFLRIEKTFFISAQLSFLILQKLMTVSFFLQMRSLCFWRCSLEHLSSIAIKIAVKHFLFSQWQQLKYLSEDSHFNFRVDKSTMKGSSTICRRHNLKNYKQVHHSTISLCRATFFRN